jgi:hypothetical protein
VAKATGGLALTDYAALEREGSGIAAAFEHVVLVDPPPSAPAEELASRPCPVDEGDDCSGEESSAGYVHHLWGAAELEFAKAANAAEAPSRETIAAVFRRLRGAGDRGGATLRGALAGDGSHPLSPETAARCFRVLAELGLVAGEPGAGDGRVGVVSSEGTDLDRSAAFRAYTDLHSEASRFLESRKMP